MLWFSCCICAGISDLLSSGDDSLRFAVQLRLSRFVLCSFGNFSLSLTSTTSRSELEDELDDDLDELFELVELLESLDDRRLFTSATISSKSIVEVSVSCTDFCSEFRPAAL